MLNGKTAVITGGSSGIGAAIARRFASLGADIAVIYYRGCDQDAASVCADCEKTYHVTARAYECDVADFAAVKETAAKIRADFKTVHILVNNAGITRDGLAMTMKEEDYDAVLDTNLKGAFNMIRHLAGLLVRSREGCIINISSVAGLMGNAGQINYSASKAGLIGMTKTIARELAPKNVRCNAIAPGFIVTGMTDDQKDNPMLKQIPLGIMGRAEDVAEAAAYLAQARYVTGDIMRVDGGIAM